MNIVQVIVSGNYDNLGSVFKIISFCSTKDVIKGKGEKTISESPFG